MSIKCKNGTSIASKMNKITQKSKADVNKVTNTSWHKSNRFGKTVAVVTAFVKSGTSLSKMACQSLVVAPLNA